MAQKSLLLLMSMIVVATLSAVSVIAPGAAEPEIIFESGSTSDNQLLGYYEYLYWNITTNGREYIDCEIFLDSIYNISIPKYSGIHYEESSPGAADLPAVIEDVSGSWFNQVGDLFSWGSGPNIFDSLSMNCSYSVYNGSEYVPANDWWDDVVNNVSVWGAIDTCEITAPTNFENVTLGEYTFTAYSADSSYAPAYIDFFITIRDANNATVLENTAVLNDEFNSSLDPIRNDYWNMTSYLAPYLETYATSGGYYIELEPFCKDSLAPVEQYYSTGVVQFYLFEESVTPPTYTLFDGDTTNFSTGSDNVSQPILEKTAYGKIVWDGSNLDFSANDFDSYVLMGDGWISVQSENLSSDVNTSARLTFYGDYTLPVIFVDGEVCTACSFVSSNGTAQVFDVSHFTNYTVQNGLGVIANQTTDKGVYWIINEDPVVSWEMTGVSGYGPMIANVSLMNGSTVIATKTGIVGSAGIIDTPYDSGALVLYPRAQVFVAQGDVITHMDNVWTLAGDILYYDIYEGSDPTSPGAFVGTANVTTPNPSSYPGGILVDIPDVSGFVKGQSYIAYVANTPLPANYTSFVANIWKGFADADPLVIGYRFRAGNWETNLESSIKIVFVDNTFFNVTFNETVTVSYETAHFRISVTDGLSNETENTTGVVIDAMTQPLVTAPSTERNGPFNVTWTASSQAIGALLYRLRVSVDGGAFSFVNTTANTYYRIDPGFEGNVTYQVRAEDEYVNTTYDNGSWFEIVLSPEIEDEVCAALTYPNEDNLPAIAKVPVNFSVYAPLGFTSPSVTVRLKYDGDTYTSTSCVYSVVDSQNRDYRCNVSMNYWYGPGDYDLNITFTDAPKVTTIEVDSECTYGQLIAAKRTTDIIGFSDAGPGVQDSMSDDPVVMRNTGNMPIDLHLTAYDLTGRSVSATKLAANRFKAGATLGSSVALADGVQKDLLMTINPESGADDDVWFWLSMPQGQLVQDYYAATAWELVGVG